MLVEDNLPTMSTDTNLMERRTKPISADGLLRLPIDIYREWGEPAELRFDLVEVDDGVSEVRLRTK